MKAIRNGEIYDYVLTKHVIHRITQREISPIMLQKVLCNGEKQEIRSSIYQYTEDKGGFVIYVITKEFKVDKIVLTVFKRYKNRSKKRRRDNNENEILGNKIVYCDEGASGSFTIGDIFRLANSGNDS
ncbi:MAG TPA: hypothetical protein PLC00_04855 [Bacteroidales bacterium]|nr:hypothetical protein [Bacteroidales bacterium]